MNPLISVYQRLLLTWNEKINLIGPEARAAVPALAERLRDPDWTVRRQAAMALGRIGPDSQAAIPALEQLTRDADQLVSKAAREALQKIRG